jgi:hypothetical protein
MKKEKFIEWLRTNGAEILPTTNSYELARFMAHGRVNIVYEGRRGIRCVGFAQECLEAWQEGRAMNMGFTQKPRNSLQRKQLALLQRDGSLCFYCGMVMSGTPGTQMQMTVEHLVGRAKGGPDHEDNLVLSHEVCNKKVANLPLIEKLKERERNLYGINRHPTA